jgi:hypothetical protein
MTQSFQRHLHKDEEFYVRLSHELQLMRSRPVNIFSHHIDRVYIINTPALSFNNFLRTMFILMVTMMYKSTIFMGNKESHPNH